MVKEYSARKGKENAAFMKVRDVFPEMLFGENLYRDDINKISFILHSYEDHEASKIAFPQLIHN